MASKGKVKITYRDYHRRITTRTIEPLQWVGYDKFLAFCHLRNENRHFRMFNIVSCELLTSQVEKPLNTKPQDPLITKWKSTNMDLVYKSQFNKGEKDWYTGQGDGYEFSMRDGKFVAKVIGRNLWNATWNQFDLGSQFPKKYEIEVSTQFTSPDLYWASLGLVFNQQNPYLRKESDFCLFAITNNGYYGFFTLINDQWSIIIPWTISEKIKTRFQLNKLQVKQQGSEITIGANNFVFASVWFDQFSGKGIGFYIQSGDNSNYAEASFSNLCVYYGNKGIIFNENENWRDEKYPSKTPKLTKLIKQQANYMEPFNKPTKYLMKLEGIHYYPSEPKDKNQILLGWGGIKKYYKLPENKVLVIAREVSGVIDQETKEVVWQLFFPTHFGILSPNNDILVLVNDRTIYLFDLINGIFLDKLSAHSVKIKNIEFCPDGRTLVSYDTDGIIYLWKLVDLTNITKTELIAKDLKSIKFDPTNNFLLVKMSKEVLVYSLDESKIACQFSDDSSWGFDLFDIIFHPIKDLLCYTRKDGSIHFIDLINNNELETIMVTKGNKYQAENEEYYSGKMIVSPDGRYVLTYFYEDTVFNLIDLHKGREIALIDRSDEYLEDVELIAIDPKKDIVMITRGADFCAPGPWDSGGPTSTKIWAWNLSEGKLLFDQKLSIGFSNFYYDKDKGEAIFNNEIVLTRNGQEKKTEDNDYFLCEGTIRDHVFSPDGTKLYLSYSNGIKVIDPKSKKLIESFNDNNEFGKIFLTNDGQKLASIHFRKIIFWNLKDWKKDEEFPLPYFNSFQRITLADNDRDIVIMDWYLCGMHEKCFVNEVVLHHLNKGLKEEKLYESHSRDINGILFSPCRKYYILPVDEYRGKTEYYSAIYSIKDGKKIMEVPSGVPKFTNNGKVMMPNDGFLIVLHPELKEQVKIPIKSLKTSSIYDLSTDYKTFAYFDYPFLIHLDIKSRKIISKTELTHPNVRNLTLIPNSTTTLLKLDSGACLLV